MKENIDSGDIKKQTWYESWILLHQLKKKHRDLVTEYRNFCTTREFLKSHDELGPDVAKELKKQIADLGAKLQPSSAAIKKQHREHQLLCEKIGQKCHVWRTDERAREKGKNSVSTKVDSFQITPTSVPPTGC